MPERRRYSNPFPTAEDWRRSPGYITGTHSSLPRLWSNALYVVAKRFGAGDARLVRQLPAKLRQGSEGKVYQFVAAADFGLGTFHQCHSKPLP